MDILTTGCGLLAAWAAGPACDAFLRWRRLAASRGGARPVAPVRAPRKLLAVIPSRAEGARVGDLAEDLRREGEGKRESEKEISSNGKRAAGGAQASGGTAPGGAPRVVVDVLVLLDGPDPDAESRLVRDGVSYLSKKIPGPAKGHVLAFLAERMGAELDSYDFILVFDADMRLPDGFFRDLNVPDGAEVFQLPVRPAGVPGPGAPRVEALSLAEARLDDAERDAEGLPVRLRGKAMGFSPRAFRLGPAAATRTTAEDSEATLALLARGLTVRALSGPVALDEPSAEAGAMARSRSRWFGGHLKLVVTGLGDLLRIAAKSPKGAFVLACDLWLRPRLFVLLALAILAIGSDLVMVVFSSSGAWAGIAAGGVGAASGAGAPAAASARPAALLALLLLLSFEGKMALVLEWFSLVALRRRLGYPPEIPRVSFTDIVGSLAMWVGAVFRGATAPSRWHRARPPR